MEKLSVWSWWRSWRGRATAVRRREMEPADMGTAFGLEASVQAESLYGLPASWRTTPPPDDRSHHPL